MDANAYAARALALFPLLLAVRSYEVLLVRATHALPADAVTALARGLVHDAIVTAWAGVLLLPLLALALVASRLARVLHVVALAAVVVLATGLARYFAITFVPLGADLLGYSRRDLIETAGTSAEWGVAGTLPFLAAIALAIVVAWGAGHLVERRSTRMGLSWRPALIVLTVGAILIVAGAWTAPRPRTFASERSYYLAVEKTAYLARGLARALRARVAWPGNDASLGAYPLLHPARYDDVLGPFLERSEGPPNIVIIAVEGLGADFAGPGARYGGFTPFLDSLADRSLYWDNFMSTAGRTFGVLPALLGSLPFGESGFMELGSRMPEHETLVSLLARRGWTTRYLTGADGHFDNIDVFMERQGIGAFIDRRQFGPGYEEQPAGEGGVSWGYGDQELFRKALELPADTAPRLDVMLTITTHEPFIPPRLEAYRAAFERRLAQLHPDALHEAAYRRYQGIFASLLYLDDGLRQYFAAQARRADYGRTIYVITGDHRLIPVPPDTRADRYHVPLLLYSPLLKGPQRFHAVSSHLDVAPSLLALLRQEYGLRLPDSVAWLGSGLDTARQFRSVHSLGLMRVKGDLDDYLDGTSFLSGERLYELGEGFSLRTSEDPRRFEEVQRASDRFVRLNRYVTSGDRLSPGGDTTTRVQARHDDSIVVAVKLADATAHDALIAARDLAGGGQFETARAIARHLLRTAPSYHDARTLIGRSFAFERRFDEARAVLDEVVRRAPEYADARAARIDVELFSGHPLEALAMADSALTRFPRLGDLQVSRARALELLGRASDARAALDLVPARDPARPSADRVRARLGG